MSENEQTREQARQWSVAACEAITRARASSSPFSQPVHALEEDGYALLTDASRLFCSSLGPVLDGAERRRWTLALPQLLMARPERCQEFLDSLERGHLNPELELATQIA